MVGEESSHGMRAIRENARNCGIGTDRERSGPKDAVIWNEGVSSKMGLEIGSHMLQKNVLYCQVF